MVTTFINLLIEAALQGFAFYSLCLPLVRFLTKEKTTLYDQFDSAAVTVARIAAVVNVLLFVFYVYQDWKALPLARNRFESVSLLNRIFGPYYFFYWTRFSQVLFIEPLRWKAIRRSYILRILIAVWLLFVYNSEKAIILLSSLNRDYVKSEWIIYDYKLTGNLFCNWIIETLIFACMTVIVWWIRSKRKNKFIA